MKRERINIIYEALMGLLALVIVIILVLEMTTNLNKQSLLLIFYIDLGILAVFAIDYFYRLIKAEKKWIFIKSNILDLIAIIPFDKAFRIARLGRLLRLIKFVRLFRVVVFIKKFHKSFTGILKTNGLLYALIFTIIIVILGALGIMALEPGMNSFGDSVWWSIVTTTTVGYGDISPKTLGGRIIAVVLMIVGIGFLSMITGAIATYFVNKAVNKKEEEEINKDFGAEQLDHIKRKLNELEKLEYEDVVLLTKTIWGVWEVKAKKSTDCRK